MFQDGDEDPFWSLSPDDLEKRDQENFLAGLEIAAAAQCHACLHSEWHDTFKRDTYWWHKRTHGIDQSEFPCTVGNIRQIIANIT
ncbi:hypothetical protein LCGC14_0142980 [marine sediment metagenome]|uniref:Uncharacterized protein n=1 Tax=marine sediment metagenome TaxID=412755 RepID=A0A0F9VGT5_9ZZZZ